MRVSTADPHALAIFDPASEERYCRLVIDDVGVALGVDSRQRGERLVVRRSG